MEDNTLRHPRAQKLLHPPQPPSNYRRARDAIALEMKDSWSNGDDRRDRGRDTVDRGVPQRSARSRSPREGARSRPIQHDSRTRDRSRERRRRTRSPLPVSREEVRERNRGRELLDTQGSDKRRGSTQHSASSNKRRKSRSPSPSRSHHKKSRRDSRSPSRREGGSSRAEKKRRGPSPVPHRRRSPTRDRNDRDRSPIRAENTPKHRPDSESIDRRERSPGQKRDKSENPRPISPEKQTGSTRRHRSPLPSPTQAFRERGRSANESSKGGRQRKRNRSPNIDRYEPSNRSRQSSPSAPKGPKGGPKGGRAQSPKRDKGGRPPRDEYRPSANKSKTKSGRPSSAASGANSIEVKSDKMANRGFFGGQQGYNPNQQMQAAFPLKPQYNQAPDPRQYSQSPNHHMTPNSYHGSPQSQSPYSAGRGGFPQQQYSPHPQYPQQQQQMGYSAPNGPQGQYYNNSQSPPYQAPTGPMNAQQNFRGNQRAFRGNNHFNARGGRGDHRGGRGGHFQNTQWNSAGGPGGAGRGQYPHSGNVTPQHMSPQQPYPPQSTSHENTPTQPAQPEEDSEDLFRPSKELQVEDTSTKKKDEEQMPPPPARAPPTGPQSQQNSKFSFAFKGAAKIAPPLPQKPEISQKLNAVPVKHPVPDRPRGPAGPAVTRAIPTEPASARSRHDFREPQPPLKRKVKKIERRLKAKPQLDAEFKTSDSVYYRKPGNESVVGSGTYGKVFKAIHVYTKSLVALKKIRMEGEKDGFPVTAVREIKLLQSLKHTNIVNLQEVMVEKNDCFMVFEYLSHDLTGLLNHPTFKLEPAHKKHLAKQLFEGLDYLHRRGVLHRDIKAANILVSSEGQLKLADFGLARFYAKRRQLDYTNRVVTIWYRSPELCLGETQYGPAVDIWSAACVLVEIFTRHAIFPGDGGEISQLEKIYAILGTPNRVDWPGLVDMAWFELLRPSARRPNVFAEKYKQRVTPAAFDLLQAMFQYDPAKRPSAESVLEHAYFITEEPKPKQAVELQGLEGDWHEFESKALRKKNEAREKEARRAQKEKEKEKSEKEKKRGPEGEVAEREAKRVMMGPPSVPAKKPEGSTSTGTAISAK